MGFKDIIDGAFGLRGGNQTAVESLGVYRFAPNAIVPGYHTIPIGDVTWTTPGANSVSGTLVNYGDLTQLYADLTGYTEAQIYFFINAPFAAAGLLSVRALNIAGAGGNIIPEGNDLDLVDETFATQESAWFPIPEAAQAPVTIDVRSNDGDGAASPEVFFLILRVR